MMHHKEDNHAMPLPSGGKALVAGAVLLALAACAAPMPPAAETETGFIAELPPEVITLADPTQNLQAVRIMDDGCYWYQHSGPVETTMLPLRTPAGNPICTPRG